MKILIDADLVVFRSAASAEAEDLGIAKYYVDRLLDQLATETKADTQQLFLTGDTNFRYQIFPEYKIQRASTPRPRHLKELQNYLVEKYGATFSEGCEADDMLGVAQCTSELNTTTIVSLDKDLLMVPGEHYSWHIEGGPKDRRWVKEAKFRHVEPLEGLRWFYTQCLTGDSSDGIKGCKGIGKVGAKGLMAECLTAEEMFTAVRDAYSCDEEFLMNGQVLYIWQKLNDVWKFPDGTQETTD